ncbi:sigma-70 family RNA polymerase sigma factor [Evansella sp. AB-P1]|uniref:sigma-70 family RNA polymerase sigma factor n=1 Tax=Evansella sp. AB-P1 TaxID=3037653 RepID=UPI00241FD31E|nr:sigma-70 family RNA polymerase sigma factor [Evansella sp. AB-P1]MDG5787142.1 sigma-70 family RNA polymerase sigma factor [Evansella sp. AB-P1]
MSKIRSFFKLSEEHNFEELIKAEQAKLYKIAYSYVKNEQDALDIVQDAVIKGYKSYHKLNEKNYFSTWMTRIVINSSIDFLRKSKDVISLESEWFDTGRNEENKTIVKMDLEKIFNELKPEQKTLLILRFYSGYTVPEIANILEKREGTIKSQLHRTLSEVKKKLGNEGGEYYEEVSGRC